MLVILFRVFAERILLVEKLKKLIKKTCFFLRRACRAAANELVSGAGSELPAEEPAELLALGTGGGGGGGGAAGPPNGTIGGGGGPPPPAMGTYALAPTA